jgi:hypothetical protein
MCRIVGGGGGRFRSGVKRVAETRLRRVSAVGTVLSSPPHVSLRVSDVRSPRRVVCLILAFAAVALGGCGGDGPQLHPVSGKVTLNGAPVAGATVVFTPQGDPNGPMPSGVTGDDGRFELTTHPHGKGAPAGEYAVVVTKYPENAREQANPKNQLPAKYAAAGTSGLKRAVKAGGGEVEPIDLTGDAPKPGK